MKKFNKILVSCLSLLFMATSVLTGFYIFMKPEENKNITNNQTNQESGVVNPSKPNDYDGMIYYASETEETGASEAPREWKGGAIYIDAGSNFVMDGGVLSNHEGLYGGAVYVANGGTFTMTGGTIEYNYSKYGGAIYVEAGGTFIIEDGDIVNNMAENAAAIYVEAGGNLKISANAYVNANEHIEVQDTLIHYYVDGVHKYSRNQLLPAFNLGIAPLDYEHCNGYFLDEEMTICVEQNDDLTTLETSESVQSMVANNVTDGTLEYNLYTRTATLEKLSLSNGWLNSLDYYLVKSKNQFIEGEVVIPKMVGEFYVTEIVSRGLGYDTGFYNLDSITSVYIPSTITNITANAFDHCDNMKNVNLHNNIIIIGEAAFEDCKSLTKITLSKNITSISERAFNGCVSLNIMNEQNSISSIGNYAFQNCKALKEIDLTNVISIGGYAFNNCTSLEKITFENNSSLVSIGGYAFNNCLLTEITIPKSVTTIGSYAFSGCDKLVRVKVEDINSYSTISFSTVYSNPLYYAKNLYCNNELVTEISLSSNITNYAFFNCSSISTVTIEDSITSIGRDVFRNCTSITRVNIEDCSSYATINFGTVYSNPTYYANNLYCDNELVTSINLNYGISSISNNAFYNCKDLVSVFIPSTVITVGQNSFNGCEKLSTVEFDQHSSCENINGTAFKGCTSLHEISLPSSLKKIRTGAFDNTGITSVFIPASVTRVGRNAFGDWLHEIYFEDTENWNVVVEDTDGSSYLGVYYDFDVTNLEETMRYYYSIGMEDSSDGYPNYCYFEKVLDMGILYPDEEFDNLIVGNEEPSEPI